MPDETLDEAQWVDFETFRTAVQRPEAKVRFAVNKLGLIPRKRPDNNRFTQYHLTWVAQVREFIDGPAAGLYAGM